jgi:two-component system nitrate/nitrite response regulator NarP
MTTQLIVHSREPFLVKGLESILRQAGEFEVIPTGGALTALTEQIARSAPEIVLLELGPEVTFGALSELKQKTDCKIVLWVNAISTELAVQAMSLGIRGILRKTLSPKLQVECLERVKAGEVWFEKAIMHGYDTGGRPPLTRREGQILNLLSQGLKNREIATHLAVSEGTVKVYLTKLFQKVGARDRFELALYGLKNTVTRQWTADDQPKVEEIRCQAVVLP